MTNPLRIVFMGTPDFALHTLQAIHEKTNHEIIAVYSQPPRPKGRGHKTQACPVQAYALDHNLPTYTPINFKQAEDRTAFNALDADIAIVAAYGLILPQEILNMPRLGCVNIHGSLLPRWRGAAPIQRAIEAGDAQTGIGLMQMEAGLDTGPVMMERRAPITDTTTATTLHDTLAEMGADMTIELLHSICENNALPPATPQSTQGATYAKMLHKNDGRIDWQNQTAQEIDRKIRALNPWPGVWTTLNGKRVKILTATPETNETDNAQKPAGTVLNKNGTLTCNKGAAIKITRLQFEGKKPMDFTSALNGNLIKIGDQFE